MSAGNHVALRIRASAGVRPALALGVTALAGVGDARGIGRGGVVGERAARGIAAGVVGAPGAARAGLRTPAERTVAATRPVAAVSVLAGSGVAPARRTVRVARITVASGEAAAVRAGDVGAALVVDAAVRTVRRLAGVTGGSAGAVHARAAYVGDAAAAVAVGRADMPGMRTAPAVLARLRLQADAECRGADQRKRRHTREVAVHDSTPFLKPRVAARCHCPVSSVGRCFRPMRECQELLLDGRPETSAYTWRSGPLAGPHGAAHSARPWNRPTSWSLTTT